MSVIHPLTGESRPRRRSLVVTVVSVLLVGVGTAWAFLAMREVMEAGGACATGGPYVAATPCPQGAWLIAVAIPLLLLACFVGSWTAVSVGAPTLFLPMWGLLFGALGWNFLEFGTRDGLTAGWLVCGVLFELMALPAWYMVVRSAAGHWWLTYLLLVGAGAVAGVYTYRLVAG